jgi:hypothetical protein
VFSAIFRAALLSGVVTLTPTPTAIASQPVPRTYEGCVVKGVFTSRDGYDIAIATRVGVPLDLRRYEGHRLQIRGSLLPGDNLILNAPPRDLGSCVKVAPLGH